MIIGIGSDVVDIRRIQKLLDSHGSRFTKRVFTSEERQKADRLKTPGARAAIYAKRFAAKEAFAKALGCGIRDGVRFKDISVENLNTGKPVLIAQKGARTYLKNLIPEGMIEKVEITLSDEFPIAQAFVIIEAR